ncbi:MAG: capsule assembly Wzi family protein [candidate division WOR-3 bacterium]
MSHPRVSRMIQLCCLVGFWASTQVVLTAVAAPLDNVPVESWVYPAVDHLKTSGLIQSVPSTSRPWTRSYAARLVAEALDEQWNATTGSRKSHSGIVASYLQLLCGEFLEEIGPCSLPHRFRPPGPILRLPADTLGQIDIDIFNRAQADSSRLGASIGTAVGLSGSRNVSIRNRFEFIAFSETLGNVVDSAWLRHVPGYRECRGEKFFIFHIPEAYFRFQLPWFQVKLGRDYVYWGPGYRSSVLISNSAPPLEQVQLCADFSRFKLTTMTAALSPWRSSQRFMSAQRLEVNFWHRIVAGIALFVVHSPDSAQTKSFFGYLNPLIPLYPEIANAGHDDNGLVGGDIAVYLPRVKLYAQGLVDNYEFAANKHQNPIRPPDAFALQAGLLAIPTDFLTCRYEYSRINNYTYYHPEHLIAFTSYDVPLGHTLGPDADEHFGTVNWHLAPLLSLGLYAAQTRRGDRNRGDWTHRSYQWGRPQVDTTFPTGVAEQTRELGPTLSFQPWPRLSATARAAVFQVHNAGGVLGQRRSGITFALKLEHRFH